ncbi:beta-ketoacyl-ACP synthase [Francisellaceae bacterium]|nr:beta-ketoacyl-ACP synthase [Francisellaceae bacterium]
MTTYLNDIGITNALGNNKNQVATGLLSGDQSSLKVYDKLYSKKQTFIGQANILKKIALSEEYPKYDTQNNQFIAQAYEQIRSKVSDLKNKYGSNRIGIVLGTSTSGIASGEGAWKEYKKTGLFPDDFYYQHQEVSSGSEFLSEYAGIKGLHYTISTACSSSGKAIAAADRLIKSGLCDAVITGGSDALCEMTLNGFDALELVSSTTSNPFSKNRCGLNIGEGAALLVLSKEKSEIKLSGTGESSDGYHISSPDPTGMGGKSAMQHALHSANLTTKDIGYINLHGTATPKNDEVEATMVNNFFGKQVPCSSTKALTGHTLGAASAHELAFCWLLLSEKYNPNRLLPKQIWDGKFDPNIPPINIINEETQWQKCAFMSNSFAFGGSNVSLVIEKAEKGI